MKNVQTLLNTSLFDLNQQPQRCFQRVGNSQESHGARSLVSMVVEVTVQCWCFQCILAPVAQYGDVHYPGARSLVLQFRMFRINMPPEDLQNFQVIFLVDGYLWRHQVLIKSHPVVKNTISMALPDDFHCWTFFSCGSFFLFQYSLSCLMSRLQ